jgi:hypothetical protein
VFAVQDRRVEDKSFVVRCQCRRKQNGDEEAKKKQIKGLNGERFSLYPGNSNRRLKICLAGIIMLKIFYDDVRISHESGITLPLAPFSGDSIAEWLDGLHHPLPKG